MKSLFAIPLISLFILSCSHEPKSVNNSGEQTYAPVMNLQHQSAQEAIGRAPTPALEGRVLTNAEIPTPLSNVQLTVFQDKNGKLKRITQLSTDSSGGFQVTQKLTAGRYEIQITDLRYAGKIVVTLDQSPAVGLILTANKKNRVNLQGLTKFSTVSFFTLSVTYFAFKITLI